LTVFVDLVFQASNKMDVTGGFDLRIPDSSSMTFSASRGSPEVVSMDL